MDWLVMVYVESMRGADYDDYKTVDLYIDNPNRPPTHEEILRMVGNDMLDYEIS